jgi:hypothetical protein
VKAEHGGKRNGREAGKTGCKAVNWIGGWAVRDILQLLIREIMKNNTNRERNRLERGCGYIYIYVHRTY